ncbi:c-type cytochrome [uncultured Sphingomonas sp.]|uniref:c-type cytochrome n=1 Tax=uncultured Sphingomonas sp. TaxID=158754 RepID=UPI0035C97EC3
MTGKRSGPTRRQTLVWHAFRPIPIAAAALVVLLLLAVVLVHHRSREARLLRADPDTVLNQPDLRRAALDQGRAVFLRHCAGCHGPDGRGADDRGGAGVPDLTDHEWLYGEGQVSEIEAIVRYGIRSRNPKGWNLASMPAYASLHPYAAEPLPTLTPGEVDDVVQLLVSYEGLQANPQAVARGHAVFTKAGCWDCHGPDARGDSAIGAPNLRDAITLYGGSAAVLRQTIEQGRKGVSPAFADRLSAAEIRAVAVYAASLSHSASRSVRKDAS